MPDSVAAALRYAIALGATALGVLTESQATQLASALTTLITVGYGIWRTHQLAKAAA